MAKPRNIKVSVLAAADELRDLDAVVVEVSVDGMMIIDADGPTIEYCLLELVHELAKFALGESDGKT